MGRERLARAGRRAQAEEGDTRAQRQRETRQRRRSADAAHPAAATPTSRYSPGSSGERRRASIGVAASTTEMDTTRKSRYAAPNAVQIASSPRSQERQRRRTPTISHAATRAQTAAMSRCGDGSGTSQNATVRIPSSTCVAPSGCHASVRFVALPPASRFRASQSASGSALTTVQVSASPRRRRHGHPGRSSRTAPPTPITTTPAYLSSTPAAAKAAPASNALRLPFAASRRKYRAHTSTSNAGTSVQARVLSASAGPPNASNPAEISPASRERAVRSATHPTDPTRAANATIARQRAPASTGRLSISKAASRDE